MRMGVGLVQRLYSELPGWSLGTWHLTHSLTDKDDSLCLDCAHNVIMLNTCFPSWSLEFWLLLGRGYLYDQLLIRTLGGESLPREVM